MLVPKQHPYFKAQRALLGLSEDSVKSNEHNSPDPTTEATTTAWTCSVRVGEMKAAVSAAMAAHEATEEMRSAWLQAVEVASYMRDLASEKAD